MVSDGVQIGNPVREIGMKMIRKKYLYRQFGVFLTMQS
jgi:hypothetical protein